MSCMGIRAVRVLGFALLIASCATIAGIAQQNTPATTSKAALPGASGGQYAETDVCKTCHEEVWEKHFANTPHAALLKGDQHGCQSCLRP